MPVLKPVLAYAENDPETSQMAEQEKADTEKLDETIVNPVTDETTKEELAPVEQTIESTTIEPTNENETSSEAQNDQQSAQQGRSAAELATREDPYDVNGLTDEEIIALANYMYGAYAQTNPTFKTQVINDKGEIINITYAQSFAVGSYDLYPCKWNVKLNGNWLFGAEMMGKIMIDNMLAYCVQPAVEFQKGEGYTPQISFSEVSEDQKRVINNIINFGAQMNDPINFYFATQFYVWESIGYSVESNLENYGAYKAMIDAAADHHRLKPSFDEQIFTVVAGETLMIKDTKNVFAHYNQISNTTNASVVKEGDVLKITPSGDSVDGEISFQRNSPYSGTQFFWLKPGAQTVTTAGEAVPTQTKLR
ncbi:hypothetical protein RV18_GL002840 [Enterococcus termitis]|nr:hypothetical protein RV18_GL002840 [Enterococcus termitis]